MEFDENISRLCREMHRFSATTEAEEKCRWLEPYFKAANDSRKAKMLFFLILNTELGLAEMLDSCDSVNFLCGYCPTLSLNDLCYIISKLELINALSTIVSTCPAVMSVKILTNLWNKFYLSRNTLDDHLQLILALQEKYYKLILNLHREPDVDSLSDTFVTHLMFTEDLYEMETWDDMFAYIIVQLKIWRECLKPRTLTDKPEFRILADDVKNSLVSVTVQEALGKTAEIFSRFLSQFKEAFQESSGCDRMLKTRACENAYFVYQTVKGRGVIKPDEEKWLELIAKEPEEKWDCDVDNVTDKIYDSKKRKLLFNKLIASPNWFQNKETILFISNNIDVFDSSDTRTLMELLSSGNCGEGLQKLYLSCFERLTPSDQMHYFNQHFSCDRNFQWESSDDDQTEMFNKLSEPGPKMRTWLMTTCIKSPWKAIAKLCRLALSGSTVLQNCVEQLKMLESACRAKESEGLDVVTSAMKSLTEKDDLAHSEKRLLITLASKLQEVKLLDFTFVNCCVLKLVESSLIAGNFDRVIFALELLKPCLKWKSAIGDKEVVLVAFAVRALSHASWNCSSFSMEQAQARELLIVIVGYLLKHSPAFDDVQVAWLRREILKSSEMNQLYFQDFLFPDDCTLVVSKKELHLQLFALLHSKTKGNCIIESLVKRFQWKKLQQLRSAIFLALIKLLPVLTTEEWATLFQQLRSLLVTWSKLQADDPIEKADVAVVDLLTVPMYCLAQDMNRNGDMSSCFEFCVRNYGRVIQQNFLSDQKIDVDVRSRLAKMMLFLLNGISDPSLRKANSMNLSCVLLGMTGPATGDGEDDELRELEEWFKKDFIQE